MKRLNRRTLIASLFFPVLLAAGTAGAAEIDVAIRYYDKRVYYAGEGPVLVQITVSNQSKAPFRFKLADERAFSVDFDVRTLSNRIVDATDILIRKRTQDQRVFFRELSVESGESFSFTEDLRDYVSLDAAGSYVVKARLYPELFRSVPAAAPLLSNSLSLNLRPAPLAEAGGPPPALDVETNAVLVRDSLPPDQVVEYILNARQKGQWEKFFLYLDVEEMLKRDGVRKRAWIAESEEGRQGMLDRYRRDLRNALVDGDIVTIPVEFQVERTSYAGEEGTVAVLEKFRFGTYVERKRYTYYLRRRDDIWMIVDYSVMNLGTE